MHANQQKAAFWNYFCSSTHMMKRLHTIVCFLIITINALAQPLPPVEIGMPKVPAMRLLHHDYIDNNQKTIQKLDGKDDGIFTVSTNDTLNKKATEALVIWINNLQAKVELNKGIDDNTRYKWLRAINEMLNSFVTGYKIKSIKGTQFYNLIVAYNDAMELEWKSQSIQSIIEKNDIEVGEIIISNYGLKNNIGIPSSNDVLLLKKIYKYPRRAMSLLNQNPNASFADSIIKSIAYKDPEQLYNYAAAPNGLGRKIQSINDPLIKKIGLLALMKTGRMYFPFLDNLYKNKISMDSITKVLFDSTGYYKLLVKTQIEYAERVKNNDTPLVMKVLTAKLKSKAVELFINEINGLHETQFEKIRFNSLIPLSPQDLYYVAVLGEEEIYTSSYLGVYKRIFEKMKTPNADTLLAWMQYDYYKKFIKIASNYNMLDDFLKRMDKANAEKLMRDFVTGLENTKTLEDAVDVANSYASIYNPEIKKLILNQIDENLALSEAKGNKRGQSIYNLLSIIFMSMDSSNKVDLVARLGIEGVYNMPINNLKDTSGRIIIQQFFYGDKDGQGVFKSFFRNYPSKLWKRVEKEQWVELSSIKGVPITIYCNKPFDNLLDLDAKAQEALGRYLEDNEIRPTIVIHRGHSYFVASTIEQLPSSAKIVLLGSCGGYQRLSDVLDICNNAHIIASKQTGTGQINIALITSITENLRLGRNLDWPTIWKNLEPKFKGDSKEKFDDYVPPYKNLGAIFITAYKLAMEREEVIN